MLKVLFANFNPFYIQDEEQHHHHRHHQHQHHRHHYSITPNSERKKYKMKMNEKKINSFSNGLCCLSNILYYTVCMLSTNKIIYCTAM